MKNHGITYHGGILPLLFLLVHKFSIPSFLLFSTFMFSDGFNPNSSVSISSNLTSLFFINSMHFFEANLYEYLILFKFRLPPIFDLRGAKIRWGGKETLKNKDFVWGSEIQRLQINEAEF